MRIAMKVKVVLEPQEEGGYKEYKAESFALQGGDECMK